MENDDSKFIISVDDGFCEWSYTLDIPDEMSIAKIVKTLCLSLNVQIPEGECRRKFEGA